MKREKDGHLSLFTFHLSLLTFHPFTPCLGLPENPEMPQDDPQQDEDQDRAKTAAAQFLGAPAGRESAKNLAHAMKDGIEGGGAHIRAVAGV